MPMYIINIFINNINCVWNTKKTGLYCKKNIMTTAKRHAAIIFQKSWCTMCIRDRESLTWFEGVFLGSSQFSPVVSKIIKLIIQMVKSDPETINFLLILRLSLNLWCTRYHFYKKSCCSIWRWMCGLSVKNWPPSS